MQEQDNAPAAPVRSKKTTKIFLSRENENLRRNALSWEALGAIASRLSNGQSFDTVLNEAIRECAQSLDATLLCVLFVNETGTSLEIQASVGFTPGFTQDIPIAENESFVDAARRGLPDWMLRGDDELASYDPSLEHAVFIPVTYREIPLGVLCAARMSDYRRFNQEEMRVLLSIANQIALSAFLEGPVRAVIEKERVERDLQFAHALKGKVLPRKFPELPGFSTSLRCLRSLQPRGDFYDGLILPQNRAVLVVGESSGYGFQGALNVANLIPVIRGGLARGTKPEDILSNLNTSLIENGSRSQMVNICLADIDLTTRKLVLYKAGNTAVYLKNQRKIECYHSVSGAPLGVISNYAIHKEEIQLGEDSYFLIVTDGISKCVAGDGQYFSRDKILSILRETDGIRNEADCNIADIMASRILEQSTGTIVEDDVVLLGVETRQ
jgi:serine phosphatase RsbU (regulator of sigma subunit)